MSIFFVYSWRMVIAVSSHLRFRLLLTGGVWSVTCRLPSISSSARRPRRSVSASTSLTISHPRRRRKSARRMHGARRLPANFARSRLSAFPCFFSCCTNSYFQLVWKILTIAQPSDALGVACQSVSMNSLDIYPPGNQKEKQMFSVSKCFFVN